MAGRLSTAATRRAPPPFWHQLPRVFIYPMNGDAIVKIVIFAVAIFLCEKLLPAGRIFAALVRLAFLAYCFGILERTARGHLTAAEVHMDDRTSKDRRPVLQVVIFIVFALVVVLTGVLLGPVAAQVMLFLACLVIPASIMVLALDERLGPALNPTRLMSTIAGIGMPYLALCAFLFLLLESAGYLSIALAYVMPPWASGLLSSGVSMYFTVSMYYLLGYVLYQNHSELGIDVQVDTAMAQQELQKSSGKVEPQLLGHETRDLIAEGKLDEAAARIESRMRKEWDNNKLHDQYLKLLLLQGASKAITREANEYIPKLMRERIPGRAVEVYEAARKVVPDFVLADSTLLLPLATQASELRRDAVAFELLKGFDKRFPDSADIPGVYMLAAKILLERNNDYAMAQKIFQRLASKFPQHPLAAEATRLAEVAGRMTAAPAA
jgi:hypothetical protein